MPTIFDVPGRLLSADEILRAASAAAGGLSDFGDDDFREPLRVLVDSAATEGLTEIGRTLFNITCVRAARNRLLVAEHVTRDGRPDAVPRPLVITGLPRATSTLLHNLFSLDERARTFRYWEAWHPTPPPTAKETDTPRVEEASRYLRMFDELVPQMRTIHSIPSTYSSPVRCSVLFCNRFVDRLTFAQFGGPKYVKYIDENDDRIANYRYFRLQLAILTKHSRNPFMVLRESATHLDAPSLLAVFPDAGFLWNHRNILDCLPSMCSLHATLRSAQNEHVDKHEIGRRLLESFRKKVRAMLRYREELGDRVFHVRYRELTGDAVNTMDRLYSHFGYSLGSEQADRIQTFMSANPKHKGGVHKYTLEEYGLDREALSKEFAEYHETFGIA